MPSARKQHAIEAQIPGLRRFAYALLRDRETADDLVQDCLARALSRWHLLRSEAELKPWLFRMLRNLHVDRLRQLGRRGPVVAYEEWHGPAAPGDGDERLYAQDVLAALARLPAEQQEALLLVGVEDLSYDEAAGVLRIPRGTLMSRLARGRAALRALTGRDGEAPAPRPGLRRLK